MYNAKGSRFAQSHVGQEGFTELTLRFLATPYDAGDFGNFEVEIEDLIHISAFQTGQLAPPGDHSLEFTVAQHPGEDLFYSQTMNTLDGNGAAQANAAYTAVQIVGSNGFPAVGAYAHETIVRAYARSCGRTR